MRIAVVSDIHANLQAWNAVLLDIRSLEVDKIVCLGDIVGYGPNPAEVLQSVHSTVDYFVLGNHDAVICGKMDSSLFNPGARELIDWTRTRLGANAMRFLKTLPLALEGGFFRCSHGDFSEPAAFNYVIEPADAMPSWKAVDHQLLFVGHTHLPGIFLLGSSGTPHLVEPQDFELEPEKRFLVNTGSVGQPRDGETRACYCILDVESRSVSWRRIPFDIDAYRNAVAAAGISAEPSYFLRHDPRAGTTPLRELLDFSPATAPGQAARDAVEVRDLTVLKRKVTRWRLLSSILLAGLVAGAAVLGTARWRYLNRSRLIADRSLVPRNAVAFPVDGNILDLPASAVLQDSVIPGWEVHLGDKNAQGAAVEKDDEYGAVVVLRSQTDRDEMRLSSPDIRVQPGMRLSLDALFMKENLRSGNIAIVISLARQSGDTVATVDQFVVKEPNVKRRGGWLQAKQTFDVPAGGVSLRYQVRGKFVGEVGVRDMSLVRRK